MVCRKVTEFMIYSGLLGSPVRQIRPKDLGGTDSCPNEIFITWEQDIVQDVIVTNGKLKVKTNQGYSVLVRVPEPDNCSRIVIRKYQDTIQVVAALQGPYYGECWTQVAKKVDCDMRLYVSVISVIPVFA